MGEEPHDQASCWRLRAEEIRSIARSMRRSFDRCNLPDHAEEWDRRAAGAEQRAGRQIKTHEIS